MTKMMGDALDADRLLLRPFSVCVCVRVRVRLCLSLCLSVSVYVCLSVSVIVIPHRNSLRGCTPDTCLGFPAAGRNLGIQLLIKSVHRVLLASLLVS